MNGSDHTPALTFTAGLAQGATIGTLTAPWAGTTGAYNINFVETAGGATESRSAALTNGSTAVAWAVGLAAACNAVTTAASAGFTNRITVDGMQFNAAVANNFNVLDDGGTNHTYTNNNFNAAQFGARIAGVFGLVFKGNESETCTAADLWLDETTNSGAFVGPVGGFEVGENALFSLSVSHNLRLASAINGDVRGNVFGQAVGQCIDFFTDKCSGVTIEANDKLVTGPGRTAAPFVGGSSTALRGNTIRQAPVTYVSLALGATGSQTVTPQTMEFIRPGTRLLCRNIDGTNNEVVIVTAIAGGTFTAVFASTKTANWTIRGMTPQDQEESTFSPVLSGSGTAGANTYAADTAGNVQRRGNLVVYNFYCDVSAVDAAMAGTLQISLPFIAESQANQNAIVHIDLWSGFTLPAGYTQLGGIVTPGTSIISLRRSGSGSAFTPLIKSDIAGATCVIGGSVTYPTSAL